jgi:hypothetical protein
MLWIEIYYKRGVAPYTLPAQADPTLTALLLLEIILKSLMEQKS